MKKVLAMLITICMVLSFVPAISFAADVTIPAVRMAYFNSGSEWSLLDTGNSESNSSCVFVAWNHSDNWNAASTFTDTDGTVTSQSVTGGTPFNTSRNAVVSFEIPEDFDTSKDYKVTLSLKVRYVKQLNADARLAVYGNSIDGTWSASSSKATFGANGTDSGLSNLPLLGLTTPLSASGNMQADETITLSSLKLTEYVKEMAEEGKTEVTFRLATPYGGAWIYQHNSQYAPTLTIEEGAVTTVNVKTLYIDKDGNELTDLTEENTVNNVLVGSTYTYDETIKSAVELEAGVFVYSEEDSTLSVVANADGTSEVVIVYKEDDGNLTFSGYEIDDEGAWCWFADPRSITYTNEDGSLDFTIIGYIDVHGDIKATQINHLTNEVNEILIRSNIQPDDHNNPTFLVLPDERIIVFYSRHTDEACFWYRVTEEKGDLTTLGEEKCLNTSANTTYPSPFLMENDPDNIYLMWRGINWHPTIAKLSIPDEEGNTAFTYGPYQMVQSTGARPYAKYGSNGVDKLYVTYTTGHPDNENPNWLYFNQIDIATMTLEDINGNTMSTIANGVLNVNRSNYNQTNLVDTDNHDWVWQTAVGEDGYPVIAMVRMRNNRADHDYYYAKWNGTAWVKTYLAYGGGAFHQSSGLEPCYSGGMAIDPDNTNIIYCSVPVEGAFGNVYEIIKYTMSDDGTEVLSTEQITKNSLKNNVRPFVIPNSEDKDIRLIWMYGDYYDWIVSNAYTTQGYCTAVMAEAALPVSDTNVSDWAVNETYNDIGGALVVTRETTNVVEAQVDGEFTVAADIYLEGNYEGTLLDLGNVQVSVKKMETQYGATATGERARVVVTVDGTDYVTSNVYGSSDCWTTFGRGTGGNYGVENYQDYVSHILTFDGEHLTLYRNGLVDIKIPAEGLTVDDVTVGSFDGQVLGVAVYDRVLNHDEIKLLADEESEVETPDAEGEWVVTKKYVDILGAEFMDGRTETLPAGTDTFTFRPDEEIKLEDGIYVLEDKTEIENEYVAVYKKTIDISKNLIYNGDLSETTTDGTYTYVTGWQGGYTNSVHNPLSNRPYLYEAGAWRASTDTHFIYTEATETESAYVTTPALTMANNGADYPWKSDVNENYMAAVLTSWMKDANDVNSYLKAEEGKTYLMSFEMKASSIASWQDNVIGFTAVSVNGDSYTNRIPGANGDINTLTWVLDDSIGRGRYLKNADEWVTIETMATANADGYFMFQLGWAHEWGQVSVRNFKICEVSDYVYEDTSASVAAELNGTKLTVTPKNVEKGCVVAVSVNNSEKVYTQVYDGETPVVFTLDETADNITVFVWESVKSMIPVVEKIKVK